VSSSLSERRLNFLKHLQPSCSTDGRWMTLIKCVIRCNAHSMDWEQKRRISTHVIIRADHVAAF